MTRRYDRRAVLRRAGLVAAATGSLAGCTTGGGGGDSGGSGGDGDGGGNTVDMADVAFTPEKLTVPVGTTVTWANGKIGHSVTAYEDEIPDGAEYFASGGFDGEAAARKAYPSEGNIPPGETYEHTFEVPGTYEYFCIPHEAAGMVGTVEVTD
jgi:plastocyanin